VVTFDFQGLRFQQGQDSTKVVQIFFSFSVCALSRLDKPFNHCRETCLIFAANSLELQTQSTPRLNVPHSGFDPDLPVLYKKVKLNRRADGAYLRCLDKQPTHAQILNSRRIFSSAAPPDGTHALRRFNSLVVPS